jgi:glycosyltransferase involved in cell wall biosynthesis
MASQLYSQSPKVSVLMLAYNHERFIGRAIESALRQETKFDYEVVIGEDCSTDTTRQVVSDWQRKYPEKIRCLLPAQNLGIHQNFLQTLQACVGEYVAVLEGDDFWTSPAKLQKQCDFLDTQPEYAICFHNVAMFWDGAEDRSWSYSASDQKQTSTLEDLLMVNFIPTCSVMVRNGLIRDLPDWTRGLKMLDWPLFILNAQHGYIGYLNESMGAYRLHADGVYSGLDPIEQELNKLKMYEAIRGRFGSRCDKLIKDRIFRICGDLAVRYAQRGDIELAKRYARMSFIEKPFSILSQRAKMLLRARAPRLFRLAHEINKRSLHAREQFSSLERSEENGEARITARSA